MSEHTIDRMSQAEFLNWQLDQDEPYELVYGELLAMAGAKQRHDRIVVNAITLIGPALRGTSCNAFTADLAVLIPNGNVRRPDVGVHCAPFDDEAVYAARPRMVIEVLSPLTRTLDQFGKLDEYKTVESLDYILLVDPETPEVMLWRRDAARAWHHQPLGGLETIVELPELGQSLRLADLYEGVSVRPRPRLVEAPPSG